MLDTLLPPLTLDLVRFSKNCDFSHFSQFLEKLEKSQFLLDTLQPPLTLDLVHFIKNCNFSNFFAMFGEIPVFAGILQPPLTLALVHFSKNCDLSNFSQFLEKLQKLQKSQFLLDTLLPPLTLDLVHFSKTAISPIFGIFATACKLGHISKDHELKIKDASQWDLIDKVTFSSFLLEG